jgi:hypothetical protein
MDCKLKGKEYSYIAQKGCLDANSCVCPFGSKNFF